VAERSGGARLASIAPGGPLHRIARAPDPWRFQDWANAGPDGTFGNRFDDPRGVYRVLYASSSRFGAFVEVLARFRPDPAVAHGLAEIAGPEDAAPPGLVPATWLRRRRIGTARVRGRFADLGASASLAWLRRALGSRLRAHGLRDLDAAAIRLSAPRRFTQEISRAVYEETLRGGRPRFAGIAYRSRLGDELRNWALFERAGGALFTRTPEAAAIAADDPDLRAALALLSVRLGTP
jgi:hypothetical protein